MNNIAYVAIPKNSNNKIVLHFQGELAHKSKKINKIHTFD
jgi:hypothetical protein